MQEISNRVLEKINLLKNWQASSIIFLVGFIVYLSGLVNPFEGDDTLQIINNPPVHSIRHLAIFFKGGTFYAGQGADTVLTGNYYRPLMTTVFSCIYTVFGAHPLYYHLVQVLLAIGSSFLLYLFFRYSFKSGLSLFLALILLVHPMNSEMAFVIPVMQDSLYFFFGILALYLLVRFHSIRSLIAVAVCLFLSLLSKETAALFMAMCLLYLFWWDRKRLIAFSSILVIPIAAYLLLRSHAIGIFPDNPLTGPIDSLSLAGRLMTFPSIMEFYITKFFFPWKLASIYFWVHPTFSLRYVLVPGLFDLAFIALVIYGAMLIRKRSTAAMWYTYCFFVMWLAIGLLFISQIFPLDSTVSEPWFYFGMAGLLGMVGVVLTVFPLKLHRNLLLIIAVIVLGLLGFRTAERGFDWRSEDTIARSDIVASPGDFIAYDILAEQANKQHNYVLAKYYAEHSVAIYSSAFNNNDLGVALLGLQDYGGALQAYQNGISHSAYVYDVENLAVLYTIFYNNSKASNFYASATQTFPKNSQIWMYLAIWDAERHNTTNAKVAVTKAGTYGTISPLLTNAIMNNQHLTITITNLGRTVNI